MMVEDLMPYLQKHWAGIKEDLLQDSCRPQPVRRVEIPKPGIEDPYSTFEPEAVERAPEAAYLPELGSEPDERIHGLNEYTRGWLAHFFIADMKEPLRDPDQWPRRRLRLWCHTGQPAGAR
jgi:hypothetical protein